jgi:hypothetical protein
LFQNVSNGAEEILDYCTVPPTLNSCPGAEILLLLGPESNGCEGDFTCIFDALAASSSEECAVCIWTEAFLGSTFEDNMSSCFESVNIADFAGSCPSAAVGDLLSLFSCDDASCAEEIFADLTIDYGSNCSSCISLSFFELDNDDAAGFISAQMEYCVVRPLGGCPSDDISTLVSFTLDSGPCGSDDFACFFDSISTFEQNCQNCLYYELQTSDFEFDELMERCFTIPGKGSCSVPQIAQATVAVTPCFVASNDVDAAQNCALNAFITLADDLCTSCLTYAGISSNTSSLSEALAIIPDCAPVPSPLSPQTSPVPAPSILPTSGANSISISPIQTSIAAIIVALVAAII